MGVCSPLLPPKNTLAQAGLRNSSLPRSFNLVDDFQANSPLPQNPNTPEPAVLRPNKYTWRALFKRGHGS